MKKPTSQCSKCHLPIVWVTLVNGRKHPVNFIENIYTQISRTNWETGLTVGTLCFSQTLRQFRILHKVLTEIFVRQGGSVAQSHFDTCMFADEFRNKK